jgi:tetratricopeptide (TPR) repeat protein
MADDFEDGEVRRGDTALGAQIATGIAAAAPEEAREYLRNQSRLTDLQIENLQKLDQYETSHLRWRRFNDRMKGTLQILLALIGLAVVVAIGAAIWSASRAEGLVVDSFSVPAGFAQAGITGEAVTEDLTQRIAAVRDTANAHSIAHSNDVRLGRDEEIKVDIPDTGISLGEVARYLRSWLGNERHLDGNLRSLGNGKLALTVALGGADAQTFVGTDFGKLEQAAAEHVFQDVDPSNYILYLYGMHRAGDALPAIHHLIDVAGSPGMLSDGYSLWGGHARSVEGDLPLAMKRLRLAATIDPLALPPHMEMMFTAEDMGHDEEALHEARAMQRFRQEDQYAWRGGSGFAQVLEEGALEADAATGSFDHAIVDTCGFCSFTDNLLDLAEYNARMHNVARARALIEQASASDGADPEGTARGKYFVDAAGGDWLAAAGDARAYQSAMLRTKKPLPQITARTLAAPLLAVALARTGDIADARAEIGKSPDDCRACETARGNIEAVARNWAGARYWFARAIHDAPSIPFAYADWGEMLLHKGDLDGAVAKFETAHEKGPQFADPLEMWGEALIAKSRSDLALAKFEEAAKYAPNWGRLHLKWGEALLWSGDRAGAQKQFAIVAHLDLTSAERSELARVSHG